MDDKQTKYTYSIGTISHTYGEQYGDGGGSQNYCYYKIGFVEDIKTFKRYSIANMCRREIPYSCKEGLSRKVYFNNGQKVLFRIVEDKFHPNKRSLASKCGIRWHYENSVEAIILGVLDKNNNLVIAETDEGNTEYSHYKKIPLDEFLSNPNEDFLTFYCD